MKTVGRNHRSRKEAEQRLPRWSEGRPGGRTATLESGHACRPALLIFCGSGAFGDSDKAELTTRYTAFQGACTRCTQGPQVKRPAPAHGEGRGFRPGRELTPEEFCQEDTQARLGIHGLEERETGEEPLQEPGAE